MSADPVPDDTFELYDLRVEAIVPPGFPIYCGARPGDHFELRGEMLHLPPGQGFSIYSLAAVLPLLAAKQRATHPNDWMSTDTEIACPDPNCPSRLRITRLARRQFSHAAATAVPLREASAVETVELRPGYAISRIIRGGWQLAGGHGPIDAATALADLEAAFDAGIATFDCADIYTGVEDLIGAFRAKILRERGMEALRRIRVHTKLVPDLASLASFDKATLRAIVDRSLARLRTEQLDLVQFHWWDYAVPGWLEALAWLDELRQAGKLALLGATNFDGPHVRAILDAGIPLVSMQTQYSLLDARSSGDFATLCRRNGVALLCYGTVAGGFLGDRWLAAPEPEAFENRSLTKYKLIIDEFGGWALFQDLLRVLRTIADRHGTDIASVATRWTLDQPGVAAAIVGARNRAHLVRNAAIGALRLDEDDRNAIAAVLRRRSGPCGEPYGLERDRTGPHGAIMKYDLNDVKA